MAIATQNPPKWHEVYPQGTQEGSEESRFFRALARHPKYVWRSVDALAKASRLSHKRVEEIIAKYGSMGLILKSDKNPDTYGYWETVGAQKKKKKKKLTSKQSSPNTSGVGQTAGQAVP